MMPDRVYSPIQEPIRQDPSFAERWRGPDGGLITCWEVGRRLRERDPGLARRAENGELPSLDWKGGIATKPEEKHPAKRYGTLQYLAEWQGLRGEDLDIDPSQEYSLRCAKYGVTVVFTSDSSRWA